MKKKVIIVFGIVAILLIWSCFSIYVDWLWFENLNFSPVFWTILLSKFGLGLVVWLFLLLIVFANLYAASRINPARVGGTGFGPEGGLSSQIGLSGRGLNYLFMAFVLIASLIIASMGSYEWDLVLRYLFQEPFGNRDPVFDREVGFYVFSLPLYIFLKDGLLLLFFFAGIVTILWYLKDGAIQVIGEFSEADGVPTSLPKISISQNAKKHLVFLAGMIVLLLAVGFYLKTYMLLYSTKGAAFGAGYTDVHARLWAYRISIILSLGLAAVLLLNVFRTRTKLAYISTAIWIGGVVLLNLVLPFLVQQLVVEPNELAKESPYITYNIEHTRRAYDLEKIKEVDFEVDDRLSPREIRENDATVRNIRIWDERPLLQTYRQIQAIRLYYDFNDVDVDRYLIDGQYRQVTLTARELSVDQLPPQANTWVNRHLTYTHGYGLAANPVNEVTVEGFPRLLVKDLPPSFHVGLEVDRPEIYYGEKTDDYVLVKTKNREFDYPKGDKNVYTTYQGKGGVLINSLARRFLFAVHFMDPQIFLTTYLGNESRIMYDRQIQKRVRTIAPFLSYDRDPYLVVSGGRLFWIQDAYTTSAMYPYSRRSTAPFNNGTLNYIRNSVKAVIDAYSGEAFFYLVDENDPVARTYAAIFPDLFKPFSEMPIGLRKHIRYPVDLFEIQARTYAIYHMEESQVFYNQEDLWEIPDEVYSDNRQQMEPYYIIIRLPEEETEEFVLMLPFTPSRKDNMIGWLAARSDIPHYGGLLVYKLPKKKLVYGPMQIEARIDQQTEISREMSLWGQRGSRVIRGNLLAIPLSDSFIYVEPVYLQAEQETQSRAQMSTSESQQSRKSRRKQARGPLPPEKLGAAALPELKRVIAAFSDRVVMDENVDKALKRLLGEEIIAKEPAVPSVGQVPEISELGAIALEHYQRAGTHLRHGNWAGYGRELQELEKVLKKIASAGTEK